MREVIYVWKKVFGNFKYVLMLLIFGFVFYLINGIIGSVQNAFSVYDLLGFSGTIKFLLISSFRFVERITTVSAVGVLLLSFLFGALVSLLVYRFKNIDRKTRESLGFAGSLGVLLGVAAPGCVACGVGVLSLVGLTSSLAVLPFKGNEIIILAVVLVGFAVVNITRKLYNPVCKVDLREF